MLGENSSSVGEFPVGESDLECGSGTSSHLFSRHRRTEGVGMGSNRHPTMVEQPVSIENQRPGIDSLVLSASPALTKDS